MAQYLDERELSRLKHLVVDATRSFDAGVELKCVFDCGYFPGAACVNVVEKKHGAHDKMCIDPHAKNCPTLYDLRHLGLSHAEHPVHYSRGESVAHCVQKRHVSRVFL